MFSRIPPPRRGILLLLIVLAFGWFAWTVRAALNPLLVALMFAYMLHPMVLSLEARGWSRRNAVNAIYVSAGLLFLGITLGSYLQARTLWADLMNDGALVGQIDERVREAAGQVEGWVERFKGRDPDAHSDPPPEAGTEAVSAQDADAEDADNGAATAEDADNEGSTPLRSLIEDVRVWIQGENGGALNAGNLWALVRRAFGSMVSAAVFAFLVPVYTWFLLFELERIQNFVRSYLPVGDREVASRIGGQIAEVLGNFFRGRLLVCLVKGLMLAGIMGVLGIPYAFLLGMLSGLFSLIPFAGPTIGYGAAFLLALLEFEPLGALWRVGLVFAIGELVEGYVLLPRILGDKLGLHPLAVFVSLTVFGAALGAFGVLLALPLTAAVVIVTRELVLPLAKDWAEGRRSDSVGT